VRIRRALVPLLLLLFGALVACGGDEGEQNDGDSGGDTSAEATPTTSETAAASDVSACGLLTPEEVEAAVGSPVKEGIASSGPAVTGGDFTTCIWQSADRNNPADTATLTIYPNADAADSARSEDAKDINGIGDKAYSDSVSSVWVYVGDQSFFAQWYIFGTMDDEGLQQSKALASAAADKLDG
jgi:hypothetical protein